MFSVRIYLLTNAVLFLVFSAACAFAQDLPQMIVLRAIQGFTGGVLIPMAFTLIITLLPKAKQPIGLALFAVSATFAPAIGPTIGGYLTENWGWQYIFYVNLVPGAVMIGMLWFSLEAKPMKLVAAARGRLARHRHHGDRPRRAADRARGRQQGRLVRLALHRPACRSSPPSRCRCSSVIELTSKKPLLNLRLLVRRNFGFGMLANFLLGVALYGSVFILPVYLSRIQGYNSEQIGMVLAWTGLPQLVLIPLVPRLMKRFDARLVIGVGFALFAACNFMNIYMTGDYAADQLFWPNVVRAIGQALVFAPLSAVATAGIEPENAGSASGAVQHDAQPRRRRSASPLLQTFLTKREQFHSNVLTQSVSLFEQATRDRLEQLTQYFMNHGVIDRVDAAQRAIVAIGTDRAEAGLHPGLQRHVLPAGRGADRRADGSPAAEEARPS